MKSYKYILLGLFSSLAISATASATNCSVNLNLNEPQFAYSKSFINFAGPASVSASQCANLATDNAIASYAYQSGMPYTDIYGDDSYAGEVETVNVSGTVTFNGLRYAISGQVIYDVNYVGVTRIDANRVSVGPRR